MREARSTSRACPPRERGLPATLRGGVRRARHRRGAVAVRRRGRRRCSTTCGRTSSSACRGLLDVLEKRAAVLELLRDAFDAAPAVRPRRRGARAAGPARRRARRRDLRAREPDARHDRPARAGADGLRKGGPLGPRRPPSSSRGSSKSAYEDGLTAPAPLLGWRPPNGTTTSCSASRATPTTPRSRRRSASSRASCTRTSPRSRTRRSAFARSPRRTRCSRTPRRGSSTTATATPACARAASRRRDFDFCNLSDLFSAFFGDDLFGGAAAAAARAAATSASPSRSSSPTRHRRQASTFAVEVAVTCDALRRRRRRAGHEPRHLHDAAAGTGGCSRSRAASSASSCARSLPGVRAAPGSVVEHPCKSCDGAGRTLEQRDARRSRSRPASTTASGSGSRGEGHAGALGGPRRRRLRRGARRAPIRASCARATTSSRRST